MKKSILFLAMLLISGNIQAQKLRDGDVPLNIKSAFIKLFPTATGVKWSKESADEFEAEFKVNNIETSSNFETSGTWLGTETEIENNALPSAVRATLAREYAEYKIEETEKAETPDRGNFYEVELKKGKSKIEIQINEMGTVLKKEEKR